MCGSVSIHQQPLDLSHHQLAVFFFLHQWFAAELGSGILFSQRIGFSGTPSSLLPTELQPCHFEVASEGKIVSTLCDPTLCKHTVYPKLGKAWTVEGLLVHIAKGPFLALIDTGALITGYTNVSAALSFSKSLVKPGFSTFVRPFLQPSRFPPSGSRCAGFAAVRSGGVSAERGMWPAWQGRLRVFGR